jgi:hypothetical protein
MTYSKTSLLLEHSTLSTHPAVQVSKKAYNTDAGKEIKGLKDGPDQPDY